MIGFCDECSSHNFIDRKLKSSHKQFAPVTRQRAGADMRGGSHATYSGYRKASFFARSDNMKDDPTFRKLVAWVIGAAILMTLFYLFLLPLFAGGKAVNRIAQRYDAETSKQVYDTSRQYQQGTQLDIDRYCRQYHSATGPAKNAVADLIRDTAATYQGPLTAANQSCISEIGG